MADEGVVERLEPLGATAQAAFAETAEEGLRKIFGFERFRPGQAEAVNTLQSGADALVVMPTGSGKSLCFQLAAALKPGITVVISPLIALMKDQVDALRKTGLPVCDIHSAMPWEEQQSRIEGVGRGDYKLVYVAPERFRSGRFRGALAQVEVGMMAVDEAHCISQWGHDFRPDYLELERIRGELGAPQTVALTATATSVVQRDIIAQLGLRDARVLVAGFERPNLFFDVVQVRSREDKIARIVALAKHEEAGSIIVYCATRKQVRQVTQELRREGLSCRGYHGGLDDKEREATQERWMGGDPRVLVATNAFGMGVDKADVRAVVHYNMPGSIEAYYQEAGRAGRDGEQAHCLLLFNFADKGIHEWFAENSYPLMTQVMRVWEHVRGWGAGVHVLDAGSVAGALSTKAAGRMHPMAVESALRVLEGAGHLVVRGGSVEVLEEVEAAELEVDYDGLEARRRHAREQVAQVVEYATGVGCKQTRLRQHFDESVDRDERCGHCSDCCGVPEYARAQAEALERTIQCGEEPGVVLKKVLAGVARAGASRGATAVAGMLAGSRSKAVREAGFDQLSTYGVLRQMRNQDVVYLLDVAMRHGLVSRNRHGCVMLTELGGDVMRGRRGAPEALMASLERSLVESSPASTRRRRRRGSAGTSETYDKTLALHREGKGVEAIAKARGLRPGTVARHLVRLAARGERLRIDDRVDADRLDALRPVAAEWSPGDPVGPLMKELGDGWSYAELRAHLTWLMMERCGTVEVG